MKMFSFLCLLLCLIRMERVWMWRVHVTNVLKHCSIHLFLVLMLILFLMYKIIFSHLKLPLSFVYFGVQQQFICLTLVDCENDSKVSSLTSVVSQSECDARWRHFTVPWISTHPSHLLFLFITSYVTCLVLSFFFCLFINLLRCCCSSIQCHRKSELQLKCCRNIKWIFILPRLQLRNITRGWVQVFWARCLRLLHVHDTFSTRKKNLLNFTTWLMFVLFHKYVVEFWLECFCSNVHNKRRVWYVWSFCCAQILFLKWTLCSFCLFYFIIKTQEFLMFC